MTNYTVELFDEFASWNFTQFGVTRVRAEGSKVAQGKSTDKCCPDLFFFFLMMLPVPGLTHF